MEHSAWYKEQKRVIDKAISMSEGKNRLSLVKWYNKEFSDPKDPDNSKHKLSYTRLSNCHDGRYPLKFDEYCNLLSLCERPLLHQDTNPENTIDYLIDELSEAIDVISETSDSGEIDEDTIDTIRDCASNLLGVIEEHGQLSTSNKEWLDDVVNRLDQIPICRYMHLATEWNWAVSQLRLCQLDVVGWKQRTLQLLDTFESMKPNQRDEALQYAIRSFSEDEQRSILYSLLRSDNDCFLYKLFTTFAGAFFDRAIKGEEDKLYRSNTWKIFYCFRERLYNDFKEQMIVDFQGDLQQ